MRRLLVSTWKSGSATAPCAEVDRSTAIVSPAEELVEVVDSLSMDVQRLSAIGKVNWRADLPGRREIRRSGTRGSACSVEVEDVFDAVFDWMNRPGTRSGKPAENRSGQ